MLLIEGVQVPSGRGVQGLVVVRRHAARHGGAPVDARGALHARRSAHEAQYRHHRQDDHLL